MLIDWLADNWKRKRLFASKPARRRALRHSDSVAAVERLETRVLLTPYTLTTGTGPNTLTVGVDGFGAFGTNAGANMTDAFFTSPPFVTAPPPNTSVTPPLSTTFQSHIAVRFGTTGTRQIQSSGPPGIIGGLLQSSSPITGTSTQANSTFSYSTSTATTFNFLFFDLTQQVGPLYNKTGALMGATLTQTYVISNPLLNAQTFDVVRYFNANGTAHGGGFFINNSGDVLLYQTASAATPTTRTLFNAINTSTGTGGNFFIGDVADVATVSGRVTSGTAFQNNIVGDNDGNDSIDPFAEYDVGLALQENFTLQGGGATTFTTVTFFGLGALADINTPPTIIMPGGSITYIEDNPGIALDANATVTDPDSTDFNTGTLTVDFAVNGSADDRLEITNQGTAAGQIGVSGNTVTFSGVPIGTFTGGTNLAPLVVTFNASSSPAAAQALLRAITFRTLNNNPSTATRSISVTITDGHNGVSSTEIVAVSVTPINDAPVIAFPSPGIGYPGANVPTTLAANAIVSDVDSVNFDTGVLQVTISSGAMATDRLEISPSFFSPIALSGSDVTYNGIKIGSFTGGVGTTPLIVTFTLGATPAVVQELIRTMTFRTLIDNPLAPARIVTFVLGDGDGGQSTPSTISILPPYSNYYRAYNPVADYHFFTTSAFEFSSATAGGYLDESTGRGGFAVPVTPGVNKLAIHRLYSPPNQTTEVTKRGLRSHYYTSSDGERDYLVSLGWTYEKDEGYIYTTQVGGSTEIFRLYNRRSGMHLFTENAAVKDSILAQFPGIWVQHSSLGFGFALGPSGSIQFSQTLAPASALPAISDVVTLGDTSAADSSDNANDNIASLISTDDVTAPISPSTSSTDSTSSAESSDKTEVPNPVDEFWSGVGLELLATNDDPLDWS